MNLPVQSGKFLALWRQISDAEKQQVIWDLGWLNRVDTNCQLELTDQPVSPAAISIYQMVDAMTRDDCDALANLFTGEMKAKKKWRPTFSAADKDAWLADENLRGANLFLAVAWLVRDPKLGSLRTSMITDRLEKVGRRLSNITTYLRELTEMTPPLAEITTEGQGRAGITFALTPAGVAAGADLHKLYAEGRNES